MEAHLRGLGMSSGTTPLTYPCPYQYEIEHLKYMDRHVTTCKETLYRPLSEVAVHWVDTEEALQSLAAKLERVTEFAVDLEHHNYRTYLGFTCLMQVLLTHISSYIAYHIILSDIKRRRIWTLLTCIGHMLSRIQ
jgi:hypothetical protein